MIVNDINRELARKQMEPIYTMQKLEQWQGNALYQAEDYAAAAERFAQGDTAADHYNRGNALAKSGELEAALDAYEQALERQPELTAAQQNKALVEEALRQRQDQQQNGGDASAQQQDDASGDAGEPHEDASAQPADGQPAQPGQSGSRDDSGSDGDARAGSAHR